MKFNITLTWSKLMALIMLGCATYLDKVLETNGSLFMFSVPFVTALILGKQGKELLSELKKK